MRVAPTFYIVLSLVIHWTILGSVLSQKATAQIAASPIPGISVEIADVIQLPDTRNLGAEEQSEDNRVNDSKARINFMRELPDSTGRWFVNDLRGDLYLVDSNSNTSQPFLNLRSEFSRFRYGPSGLSTGLLSVTPHPEYAANGKFYTLHSETFSGSPTPDFVAQGNAGNINGGSANHVVLTEWTATDPSSDSWAGSHTEMMRIAAPSGFLHAHGDVAFNPVAEPGDEDYGLLYVGGGDYGYDAYSRGDPQAQRLDSIYGKILRIDPAGNNSANGNYGVPTSNPYAADGNADTADEIYASGLRNAHRLMWDQQTGVMYTTDIGQGRIEEINIVRSGENYGWSEREGTFEYLGGNVGPLPGNDATFGYTYPVVQYDHDEGNAIAGGFVYRGTQLPELYGKFVFGDIVNGRVFYSDVAEMDTADDGDPATTADIYELFLTRNGAPTTLEDLILADRGTGTLPNGRHDLRFGQTSDGEVYLMTKQDGWIRQLVGDGPPSQLVLSVDRATGTATMRNSSGSAVDIQGYSILSASGSLGPDNATWNSFSDQLLPDWNESVATSAELDEASSGEALSFADSQQRSIGTPYQPAYSSFGTTGPEDLQFTYIEAATQQQVTGLIEYTGIDETNNLVLTVDPTTGLARLSNPSPFDVSIDGYSVDSFEGSLQPGDGNWNSLSDQSQAGWREVLTETTAISELNPDSDLFLASGSEIELGTFFLVGGEQDLEFNFLLADEEAARLGVVLYQQLGISGDYNNDGEVNIADYTVWRNHLGSNFQLPNEGGATPGQVTVEDYALWKSNFGQTTNSAATSRARVPEPSTLAAMSLSLLLLAARFRLGTAPANCENVA